MPPSTYDLYSPQNEPVAVADDLWTVEGPAIDYQLAGLTIPCPTRMTVVRLADGGLWLHSPIPPTSELRERLSTLGPVSALVAPNSFHTRWLAPWADAVPEALVFVSPRIPKAAVVPERAGTLTPDALTAWRTRIDMELVDAGAWCEALFFHRPTRTLIVTDLIQHFETARLSSPLIAAFLRIGGATGDPPRASLEMRMAARLKRRRHQVRESFGRVKAWQPQRVLIAHGQQPTGNMADLLNQGFAWAG